MSRADAIVLIGGGGHAGVVADACEKAGLAVAGYLAPAPAVRSVARFSWLGDDSRIDDAAFTGSHSFILAMGDMKLRQQVGARLAQVQARLAVVVHPSAILGYGVDVGAGSFVAAGAVINPGTRIGLHAIINTRASVDHDCVLGDHVHIAPGATLGGGVTCGEASFIGIGAAVRHGCRIGSRVVVGAGAAVVGDLVDGIVALGVPARQKPE